MSTVEEWDKKRSDLLKSFIGKTIESFTILTIKKSNIEEWVYITFTDKSVLRLDGGSADLDYHLLGVADIKNKNIKLDIKKNMEYEEFSVQEVEENKVRFS
jgi:hypothetical protein